MVPFYLKYFKKVNMNLWSNSISANFYIKFYASSPFPWKFMLLIAEHTHQDTHKDLHWDPYFILHHSDA